MSGYVFGPHRTDDHCVLIHRSDCGDVNRKGSGPHQVCPLEVVEFIVAIHTRFPYGQERRIGLANCLGYGIDV